MGRQLRPHLPGATFHLTARLQHREPLFEPRLRTNVVAVLREQVAYSDLELFAYVVMPNHIHLLVRQGVAPLGRFMQTLLRRIALTVHGRYGREGHVFERRYRDTCCGEPQHLRNAIVYAHLNPVRAGLCREPADYPWSSHSAWSGGLLPTWICPASIDRARPMFAAEEARTGAELRADYRAFEHWRRECDRAAAAADPFAPPLPRPETTAGDAHWARCLAPGPGSPRLPPWRQVVTFSEGRGRPDLAAIAAAVLREAPLGLEAGLVRSRWGGPAYVRARHRIIRRAGAAGYRGVQIAAYLRISATAVSAVLTADRKRLIPPAP